MYLEFVFIISFNGFICSEGFVAVLILLLSRKLFWSCGLGSSFIWFNRSFLIDSLICELPLIARIVDDGCKVFLFWYFSGFRL